MAGDNITWRLSADTSQVRSEMASAVQSVSSASHSMVRDLDGVTTSHSNLLRSDHRVAASMRGLTKEMLSGGDAIGALGIGLESLAMATNVSLPALIGLEVVGKVISEIAKAHEEAVKLDKELTEAGKPRDPKSTVPIAEDIKKRREVVEKGRKDIEEKTENPWITGTNWIWKSWEGLSTPNKEGPKQDRFKDFDRKKLQSGEEGEQGPPKPVEYHASDLEIEKRKTEAADAAADAIERQAAAEKRLKEISETVAKGKLEKLQFTLAELAKSGRDTAAGDDSRPGAGRLAKIALKEEALAKKEMLAEHYDEAARHQSIADKVKNSIVPLKDSEKDTLNALERAESLKAITAAIKALSFRNR